MRVNKKMALAASAVAMMSGLLAMAGSTTASAAPTKPLPWDNVSRLPSLKFTTLCMGNCIQ